MSQLTTKVLRAFIKKVQSKHIQFKILLPYKIYFSMAFIDRVLFRFSQDSSVGSVLDWYYDL